MYDYYIYSDGSAKRLMPSKKWINGSGAVIIKNRNVIGMVSTSGFGTIVDAEWEGIRIGIKWLEDRNLLFGNSVKILCDNKWVCKSNIGIINYWAKEFNSNIRLNWIKGHSGNKYNDAADELSKSARKYFEETIKNNYAKKGS